MRLLVTALILVSSSMAQAVVGKSLPEGVIESCRGRLPQGGTLSLVIRKSGLEKKLEAKSVSFFRREKAIASVDVESRRPGTAAEGGQFGVYASDYYRLLIDRWDDEADVDHEEPAATCAVVGQEGRFLMLGEGHRIRTVPVQCLATRCL